MFSLHMLYIEECTLEMKAYISLKKSNLFRKSCSVSISHCFVAKKFNLKHYSGV